MVQAQKDTALPKPHLKGKFVIISGKIDFIVVLQLWMQFDVRDYKLSKQRN
jgi:hypothetical protein